MQGIIAEFNADAARLGSDVRAASTADELIYRIAKLDERLLNTPTYNLILQLSKMSTRATVIDLGLCRVVSSIELTLIGYILTQTRFHGGKVRIICPSPVNRRALLMVGFDRLASLEPQQESS